MARSNENTNITIGGCSTSTVLFIVFLVLKLIGVISWSWWWVTAPIWIPIALLIGFLAIMAVISGIIALIGLFTD